MLFLTPVGIVIGLSGEVYCNKNGQIISIPAASRLMVSIGVLAIILIKLVGPILMDSATP